MDLKLSKTFKIVLAIVCILLSILGFMLKLPRVFREHDRAMHAGFYFLAAGFFNVLFAGRSIWRHGIIFALLFGFSVAIEHAQEYSNILLGRTIHGRYDPEDVKYNLKGLIYFSGVWLVWWIYQNFSKKTEPKPTIKEDSAYLTKEKAMLTSIHPKLPMRDKAVTQDYYTRFLGFEVVGDYPDYLMLEREGIEIHFFAFAALDPLENYGQVYIRVSHIDQLYKELLDKKTAIHPNGPLQQKPWGQKEFSLLDPDHNLLTFGESAS
jgi:catechol 2,3-dioxygenase-like lactoylglutathione lyase family enzyme